MFFILQSVKFIIAGTFTTTTWSKSIIQPEKVIIVLKLRRQVLDGAKAVEKWHKQESKENDLD